MLRNIPPITRQVKSRAGRILCGWCPPDNRADLGPADVDGETTGICPACRRRQLQELELFVQQQKQEQK